MAILIKNIIKPSGIGKICTSANLLQRNEKKFMVASSIIGLNN